MSTKNNPGEFDCYANALPDEPMFILLGRDPDFSALVQAWALRRKERIHWGECPESDHKMVMEALDLASYGAQWRRDNEGKWRSSS